MNRSELERILLETVKQKSEDEAYDALKNYIGRDPGRFLKDKKNEIHKSLLETLIGKVKDL